MLMAAMGRMATLYKILIQYAAIHLIVMAVLLTGRVQEHWKSILIIKRKLILLITTNN